MKVILKDDVQSLGHIGETVNVSEGYARNYLIPKGLAIEASTKNLKTLEHEKALIEKKAAKARQEAEAVVGQLAGISLTIARKVGEQDKLYGAVTAKDIEEALKEQGVGIDRKKIVLDEPIKNLGSFTVKIKVHAGVTGDIAVQVVAAE